jgi:hypothetical protein
VLAFELFFRENIFFKLPVNDFGFLKLISKKTNYIVLIYFENENFKYYRFEHHVELY